jgi:hypothetical protein
MAIGAKGEEMRQVFWLPPKQNPEIIMRQMAQGGGAAQGDGSQGGGGQGGDGNPIVIPTPQPGGGENPPTGP